MGTKFLPWTKGCFVCGVENPYGLQVKSRLIDQRVVIEYRTRDTDVGYQGIIHGGIVMTLLDEVMTWASILSVGRMCVAAEMTTRLKNSLGVGTDIQIQGWSERTARRICFTRGEVRDTAGVLFASASGKYMPVKDDQTAISGKEFVISPEALNPEELFGKKE